MNQDLLKELLIINYHHVPCLLLKKIFKEKITILLLLSYQTLLSIIFEIFLIFIYLLFPKTLNPYLNFKNLLKNIPYMKIFIHNFQIIITVIIFLHVC